MELLSKKSINQTNHIFGLQQNFVIHQHLQKKMTKLLESAEWLQQLFSL